MFFAELHEIIVIYEFSTFRFIKMQILMLKEAINSETKLPYLGIFGLKFENTIVILEISSQEFLNTQIIM